MNDISAWWFYVQSTFVNDWLIFTVTALFVYGIYQYLLDICVTEKTIQLDNDEKMLILLGGVSMTSAVLSGAYVLYVAYVKSMIEVALSLPFAIILGVIQGALFMFTNIFRFEARKVLPNSFVLPVTKVSVLIVVVFSWVMFDEFAEVTGNKLVGLVLIGLTIYLFKDYRDDEPQKMDHVGVGSKEMHAAILYIGLATLATAAITLLSKYAVGPSKINIFLFVFTSNVSVCIVALILLHRHMGNVRRSGLDAIAVTRENVLFILSRGMKLGLLNIVAFSCLLNALALGSASIVIPIYSLYIAVPILLSAILQGDILTPKTTVAVILSISAVVIM